MVDGENSGITADVAPAPQEAPKELSETDKIRVFKAKLRAERLSVQAALEEPEDKVYTYILRVNGEEKPIRFHRWTHDQANMLYTLPFAYKFTSTVKVPLDDEDKVKLDMVRQEMVLSALADRQAWEPRIAGNVKAINLLYGLISLSSMMTPEFYRKINEFMASDLGMNYGWFLFVIMRKLPSQIGKCPDSDILAANVWLAKWGEKTKNR